ncbi:MAG: two-component system, OmpR family, response regulator [Solirubrobacteraceae bacterium]|nr:two-component system, OmpR family, response regulator [Solirubrobacteraceae bacterium]
MAARLRRGVVRTAPAWPAEGESRAAARPTGDMTGDDAATILVVEDDHATRTFLADNLTADGYELLVADCAAEGLRLLETKFPDLAVIDVGLPDASGYEVLRRVRTADGVASRVDPATPLMLLTGRDGELDRVRGFERGADDYVCKPFSYPELRGRVAALLRRADQRQGAGRLRVGALEVDPPSRTARLRGEPLALSQKEFALLRALAAQPTRVFTKEELLRSIWGFRHLGTTRTLDSHACRLRVKLGVHGDRFVVNVWGVGYRLVDGPVRS